MHIRRLTLLALSLGTVTSVGCFRNLKRDAEFPRAGAEKAKLPAPSPSLPTQTAEDRPSAGGVQPPKIELAPGSVPKMPGLPGGANQPIPNSVPDSPTGSRVTERDDLTSMAGDDGDRKGILERLRERRKEKEKQGLPELPPAVEPKKEDKTAPPKEPVKPVNPLPQKSETEKPKATTGDLATVRTLVDEAAKKFKDTPEIECKLTKRETVNGKKQPTEEMRFLFRQEPFSVRLTVTGENGRGREVLFVKGQNAGKLVIVTGEGDNRLLGAGKKLELDPDSSLATSRTRGKIEDSGLGRPIRVLTKFVTEAEKGTRTADSVKALGSVQRKEFATPVDGVEVTLKPTDDPLMPKGGKRLYFFDADPKSPSHRLPVLVITYEPNDTEVEYFLFTDFKLPAKLTDADFSADKLGKRK